jgi:hypothetical protein
MLLRATLTLLAASLLALAVPAAEAQDAGSIVSMEGTVEIGRAGSFSGAQVGTPIQAGDTIRTGNPGRARVLFADESVLNIGDGSTIVIDETVYDPSKGAGSTLMHLLGGKVRAVVSEYYGSGGGSYQIETATAVSGVRGTEYVIAYDPARQLTEVLGLGGEVAVHGTIDRKRHGVIVHANEITEVAKGKYPTPPRQITEDDERYQRLMAGLDLPGSGLPESLLLNDPVMGGDEIPNPDTADGNVNQGRPGEGTFGEGPHSDLPPESPAKTGGDLLEQPAPVLEAPTDIDIHF